MNKVRLSEIFDEVAKFTKKTVLKEPFGSKNENTRSIKNKNGIVVRINEHKRFVEIVSIDNPNPDKFSVELDK